MGLQHGSWQVSKLGESGPPNTLCDCLHEYTHKHMRGKHHDNIRYKTDGITGVIGLNWTDMDRILVLCKKVKLVISGCPHH